MGLNAGDSARHGDEAARRELFAVLAHELRSPIGAILGFEELLSEGILGEIPATAADALARIRGSARQLLDLVAGLNDLALEAADAHAGTTEIVTGSDLLADVIRGLEGEATGRGAQVRFQTAATLPTLTTDTERARRALQLALMAAIKASSGAELDVRAEARDGKLHVYIDGTRLDAERDDPDVSLHREEGAHLTGPGLRIAMARRALAPIDGQLRLLPADGTTALHIIIASLRAG